MSLVAIIQECQVLLDDREERDEGRCRDPLEFSVLGHVVEGIHETQEILGRREGGGEVGGWTWWMRRGGEGDEKGKEKRTGYK